jgi:acyl carrier protein
MRNNINEIDKIKTILFNIIDELNEELSPEQQLEKSLDTVLLGRNGKLDSMGLVRLIVATEQKVTEELGVPVSLTDERAFSQDSSPFQTVGTLLEFIARELAGGGDRG